jgi:GNAT superfamily N-acetyltransferase
MSIKLITTDDELRDCFTVYHELRPHLENSEQFIHQVRHQYAENFLIAALFNQSDIPVACVGFRLMHTLAWGKIIYIDDLVTSSQFRSNGAGNKLLDYVIDYAKEHNCAQVHLDTGYQRNAAHKVYLAKGFQLNCHHLALDLA